MSLNASLPSIQALTRPDGVKWDAPDTALAKWADLPLAAEADDDATISIYDQIGEDFFGAGFTAKRAAAALRSIGKRAVTVNINSPGGDFFEGLAIYNLLRDHPEKVTVRIMGLAASAASVIAMAGDEVLMADGSFLMIHNAWAVAIGNRHDMRAAADLLEPFDGAMADIYTARTGAKRADIQQMLDDETWLNASAAIEAGFADARTEAPAREQTASAKSFAAVRRVEAAMAAQGISRDERRSLIGEMQKGSAVASSEHPAVAGDDGQEADLSRAMQALASTIIS